MEYPQHKKLSDDYIIGKISDFLAEDIPNGDITTESTTSDNSEITAEIHVVEKLVFAGSEIIPHCFGEKCEVKINHKNGALLSNGDIIGVVIGSAREILSRERVMLNLIQRLCGIATLSNQYAEIAKPFNVKILDTRKTTPGLRLFEKYAVAIGGAFNHRLNLSDGILIKDNHIVAAGSVENAINSARKLGASLPLELEVDNFDQIHEALKTRVDGFLLDNMNPETIKSAVAIIRNSKNGHDIFIEASGGINLKNICPYLDTGINAISIGALTHQAVSKNIRLDFI
ncbi:MAG: carboxylating nicotinate-nucleotide diphosphorylase [Candidatus Marinimicrobia bacterium]|nr:carboxylating nicotinate-nucleotide diphosphorylase [Candidatus Neomarinimicrobiota bacterium]